MVSCAVVDWGKVLWRADMVVATPSTTTNGSELLYLQIQVIFSDLLTYKIDVRL